MQDVRIERWAHTLVHYCLYVRAGERVAIRATPLASPLLEAVYRELVRVGAYPLPMIELESFEEILLKEGNDTQLGMPHSVLHLAAEDIDAQLFIDSKSNTKSLSGVEPARLAKRRQASKQVSEVLRRREQAKMNQRMCPTHNTNILHDIDPSKKAIRTNIPIRPYCAICKNHVEIMLAQTHLEWLVGPSLPPSGCDKL